MASSPSGLLLDRSSPLSLSEADAIPMSWARPCRFLVLLLTDVVAAFTAAVAAYLLWASQVLGQPVSVYLPLLPLLALLPAGYALAGLYPGFGLGPVETFRRASRVTSLVFLTTAALVFLLKVPDFYSRATFSLTWAGTLVLVPVARSVVVAWAHRLEWWPEPCLVVASAPGLAVTHRLVTDARRMGYRPAMVATVSLSGSGDEATPALDLLERQLADRVASRGIRVAIVDGSLGRSLRRRLQTCFRHVIRLRGYSDVEMAESRHLGRIFGLEFSNELLRRRSLVAKRGMDLLLGTGVLLVAMPIVGLAVAVVKIISPGPGLYRQTRDGLDGRSFSLWKIRTMVPGADADDTLAQVLATDPSRRREWEDGFKMADDPRVIPLVGPFLRRFHIDELPQLWNVLRGEMSLVGPRPLPHYHLCEFESGYRQLRQRVLPGMTGLWQVRTDGSGSAATQQVHDEFYVRNWSVWLDLYVLARTALILVKGRPVSGAGADRGRL